MGGGESTVGLSAEVRLRAGCAAWIEAQDGHWPTSLEHAETVRISEPFNTTGALLQAGLCIGRGPEPAAECSRNSQDATYVPLRAALVMSGVDIPR